VIKKNTHLPKNDIPALFDCNRYIFSNQPRQFERLMNINELMKQAQQFQEKLATVQNDLGSQQVTGSAGAGMVTATLNGRGELLSLTIEQAIVQPENTGMLQDLVVAAVNDGLNKAKELGKSEMTRLTGGLNIPGLM
jgi:DNA-binding YbaB/EbfC family protein